LTASGVSAAYASAGIVTSNPTTHSERLTFEMNGYGRRVWLAGLEISDEDCFTLIDLLSRVGRADDVLVAERIDRAVERDLPTLALSAAERDTLLGVLDDPPESLFELRGALAWDRRNRRS
jgi:hypothetical protein